MLNQQHLKGRWWGVEVFSFGKKEGKVLTMCIRGLICEPGRRQRLKRLRRHSRSSAHFSSPLHIFPMVRQVHRVLLELWDQLWSNSYSKRLVLYLPSCSSFRVNGFSSASFLFLWLGRCTSSFSNSQSRTTRTFFTLQWLAELAPCIDFGLN